MSQIIEVTVPDIGDFESVPVIDLFVKVGDTIKVDDAIVTLESDKATMDVPSTVAGVVTEVLVQLGSKVGEGALLIKVETGGAAAPPAPAAQAAAPAPVAAPVAAAPAAGGALVEVKVPDIGDFAEVPVIELYVKVGDSIKVDDAIATLESDKATMDVPSTVSGIIKEVLVQLGSKVGEGTVLIKVETGASAPASATVAAPVAQAAAPAAAPTAISAPVSASTATAPVAVAPGLPAGSKVHASPSVRAYARELGVDLSKVAATGPKNRIVKEDLTKYVKGVMSGAISGPVASATGGVVGGGVLDPLPGPKGNFGKVG